MQDYVDFINEDWAPPQPIKVNDLNLPDMPEELLPPKLYSFCEDVANDTNSPLANCAVPLLCALGAVLGSKVGVFAHPDSNHFQAANLSGIVVGGASTRKSPAPDIIKTYLQNLEYSYADENAKIELQHYQNLEVKQKNLKQLSKSGSANPMQLAQLTAEINAMTLNGCPKKRLLTSDSTVEKIQMLMLPNPRGIILFKDEITSFFNEIRSDVKDSYRTFVMEAYKSNCGFNIDRIGRGSIHIPRITFSMFGTVQTDLFKDIMAQWFAKYKIDGFFARIGLLVVSKRLAPQKIKPQLNPQVRVDMKRLFSELDQYRPEDSISVSGMRITESGILGLTLSTQAQQTFDDFNFQLEYKLFHNKIKPDTLEAHLGKQASMVLKVALILHLVDHHESYSPVQIDDITIHRALAWYEFILPHLIYVYSSTKSVENPAEVNMALAILEKIAANKITNGMTVSVILKKDWSEFKDRQLLEDGLNVLAHHGWLEMVSSDPSLGGYPTSKISVHPDATKLLLDESNYILRVNSNQSEYLDKLKALLEA
jgi:putative DNA primase/helicase